MKPETKEKDQDFIRDVLIGNFGFLNDPDQINFAINQLEVYIAAARADERRRVVELLGQPFTTSQTGTDKNDKPGILYGKTIICQALTKDVAEADD